MKKQKEESELNDSVDSDKKEKKETLSTIEYRYRSFIRDTNAICEMAGSIIDKRNGSKKDRIAILRELSKLICDKANTFIESENTNKNVI